MGHWTTESSKAIWEKVRRDARTLKLPDFPKKGSVEVAAMCRHTPIKVEWNCNDETITIDGKPVKIIYMGGWAFKVRREGIYTTFDTGEFVYQLLSECADDGPLDTMYYDMLKKAEKICTRAMA